MLSDSSSDEVLLLTFKATDHKIFASEMVIKHEVKVHV